MTAQDLSELSSLLKQGIDAAEPFRLLAESIPQLVWTARPDGPLDYANRKWIEYTGLSSEQSQGWSWKDAVHPDDLARCLDRWTTALGTVTPYEAEVRLRDQYGEYRWFLSRAEPVCDREQRPVCWFGTCTDIHEHKIKFDNASERCRRIVESANEGIWKVAPDGQTLLANPRMAEMLGCSIEALSEKSLFDYVFEADLPLAHDRLQRCLAGERNNLEWRLRRADGSELRTLAACNATFDPAGRPIGTVALFTDLTPQMKAEREARDANERLQIAMDAAGLGLYECHPQTGEVHWDGRVRDIWGIERDEVVTYQTFFDGLHPDDRAATEAALNRAFDPTGDGHYNAEYRVIHRRDQTVRWISANGKAVFDHGQPVRLVGTLRDISAHKESEEQQRRNETRYQAVFNQQFQFLAILSPDGVVQQINDLPFNVTGVSRDDVLGRRFWETPWWNDLDEMHQQWPVRLEEAAQATGPVFGEVNYLWADGTQHVADCAVTAVRNDAHEVEFFLVQGNEITDRKASELALRENEQLLRIGVEVANFGLAKIDYATDSVSLSPEAARLYGFGDDSVTVSRSEFYRCFHPEDRDLLEQAITKRLKGEGDGRIVCEHRVVDSDGTVRWLDVRKQVFFDESSVPPRPSHGILAARDITDFRETQRRISESSTRLAMALRAGKMVAWEACGDSSVWEPGMYTLLGIPPETKPSPENFLKCVHPDDVKQVTDAWNATAVGKEGFRQEFRIVRPDGEIRWLAGTGEWTRDSEGNVISVHGINWDITDQQEALNRIRLDEQRLRTAAEAAGFGTLFAELSTGMTTLSPEFLHLIGLPDDSPAVFPSGETPEWVHPEDRQMCTEFFHELTQQQTEASKSMDHRIVRPDGQVQWLRLLASPVFENYGKRRKMHQIVGTVVDITDRRNYEQSLKEARDASEAANQAKSEFLANMSHEIRTPMTAIKGYAELLTQCVDDPQAIEHLETIRRNGDYLLEIINDILDLSKIEAGRLDIDVERFEPARIVDDVRRIMDIRASDKGVTLKLLFETPIPQYIQGDAKRLKQILINLVGNAIKFTSDGEVTLSVRMDDSERPTNDARKLRITVTDTGIGMTKDQQQRLFQPFSQGDSKISRQFGGTGLGLAISQRLARLLGGDISVDSTFGQGSAFSATIATGELAGVPLIQPTVETARSTSEEPPKAIRLSGRILIVDDSPDIRFLSKHFITRAGGDVSEANDGIQALAMVEEANDSSAPFDLILLDMQMPNMDGYETATALRKKGFRNPIIALTADAMQGQMDQCLQAGCDDYLSKPIDKQEMLEKLAGSLSS